MKVVAEGVETTEQFNEVASLACDAYQGFYFASPMPTDELDDFLATTCAHTWRPVLG